MKDSGIQWVGKIPDNWKVGKVKNLFKERKNKNKGLVEKNLLSLSYGNIVRKNINTTFGLLPESFETYNRIEDGDIVFRLTDLQNDKKSLRTGLCTEKGIITSAYTVLIPPENTNPAYLHYLFHSFDICKVFYNLGDGVRQGMNYDDLGKLSILLPPQDQQKKIADFLDSKCSELQSAIDNTKQTIEEYKKLKQAVITKAVTKGLEPNRKMKDSGIEWIGEIPENWEVCKVRHLGSLQNGISKGGDSFGKGFPFVSYGDVYKNYSIPEKVIGLVETDEEEQERYSVQKGDIFFTRTSETIEEVGFSSVCEKTIDKATFAGFLIRLRPSRKEIDTGYAKYYFRSNHNRYYLVKEMNLVTRASLGQGLLNDMPVCYPPLSEQKSIAEYLDSKCSQIDTLISQKEQFITELEKYKQSLIYEYVTGKRVLN